MKQKNNVFLVLYELLLAKRLHKGGEGDIATNLGVVVDIMAGQDPDFVAYQKHRGAWKKKRYRILYGMVRHFTNKYVDTKEGANLKWPPQVKTDEQQLFGDEEDADYADDTSALQDDDEVVEVREPQD